jgi:nitrite reductase/ring-hydroxylating ferredoxin subunit
MGEDLVLFRDNQGTPGLVGLHCSHRLVSLEYGRVEDGGIRCPMHGWVYDVNGRCLEQPAEPDPTFKDRVQHRAYPCQDLGGLIFTYMGPPDRKPLLPNYEALVRTDGTRQVTWYPIGGNYVQHVEGALDTIHGAYLHNGAWSKEKDILAQLPYPKIDFAETDYGLWQRGDKSHAGGTVSVIYTYFIMPAGFLRIGGGDRNGSAEIDKNQSWYTPVDDGSCMRYQVSFAPFGSDGSGRKWSPDGEVKYPGPDVDYGRDYYNIDSISGVSPRPHESFRAQDTLANQTQGMPIVDRSLEHLGAFDQPLVAMRMMMLKGISDVQKGLDPKHIIRDPADNEIVFVRGTPEGTDPLEYFVKERELVGTGSAGL